MIVKHAIDKHLYMQRCEAFRLTRAVDRSLVRGQKYGLVRQTSFRIENF